MEITVAAAALKDALTSARALVPSNPRLVAHSGVLLLVKSKQLSVVGTDGASTLSASIDAVADTTIADGQTLAQPKPVSDYLSTVPADGTVTLRLDDAGELAVAVAGRSDYRFRPLEATFPLPAPLRTPPVPVDWAPLKAALDAVERAVDRDEGVVQLISDGEHLALHATDHFRLAKAAWNGGGFGEFVGVVDVALLRLAARFGVDTVTVGSDGKTLRLAGGGMVLMLRCRQTSFPAVETVLAKTPPQQISVPRKELLDRLRRLASVEAGTPLTVTLDGATMTLTVDNPGIGHGEETIDVAGSVAAPFTFAVRAPFLTDGLAGHPGDTVVLRWSSPLAPIHLTSSGDLDVVALVMPMKTV